MESKLKEQIGDFIVASSVGRLKELEGTVATRDAWIQELEQQVANRDTEIAQAQAV